MNPAAAAVSMVLVGAQLSLQAPVNRRLAAFTGALPAAVVSYLVGTVILAVACLLAGELGGLGRLGPEWWRGFSGCLGAGYVFGALVVVRTIGAGGAPAGTVSGQLTTSVLIDAAGWFGVEQRALDSRVVVGAAAVLLGTYLVAASSRRRCSAAGRSTLAAIAVITLGGALIGIQNALNAEIATSTGGLPSALLTFITGGALLAVAMVAGGATRGLAAVPSAPRLYLSGGVFGVVGAVASLTLIAEVGAGTVVAAVVTGQVLGSLAIDRAGLFGLEPRPLRGPRLLGAILLIAGTALVAR